jgi:glycosyltransferase involved in cell wall biosynthesis
MGSQGDEPVTIGSRTGVHAVQISFCSDPEERPPAQLLDAWSTLVDVAEAASRSGIRVSVLCASAHSECLTRNGIPYHFLPFGDGQRSISKNAALAVLLRDLDPDVLHVHGLGFPRDVLSLAPLAPGVPVILQDHANRPPRLWRRALWRRGMSLAAGIAFCASDQAQPFAAAGLLDSATRVYEIPESTSRFSPGDKQQARRVTGVDGDPAILWVGHLNANKDPLTVLKGISAAARDLPGLRLFCCFGDAPLLGDVLDLIATDPQLSGRVRLLARVPHEHIEQLMRAADLFVLGSHCEGSGYSVIESLACGLPPIVTDIPSFRSLTGAGAVGKLWTCDDPLSLCAAIRTVGARTDPETRAAVRAHFDRELSFDSLGRKIAAMYMDVLERARKGAASMVPRGVNRAARTS